MTSSASFRFAFAFGTTIAILYVAALARDVALFTVFPSLGVVLTGRHHTRDVATAMGFLAPAIDWYGWAATAAFGALMLGFVAALLTRRWTRAIWRGWIWLVPALSMIACVDLTLPWFRLSLDAPRAPNVVIVLVDDMGFGIPSASGGCVNMPTTDRLANGGL